MENKHAKIPQPSKWENLDEQCPWCLSPRKEGSEYGAGPYSKADRWSFICHTPRGVYPELQGWSEWKLGSTWYNVKLPRTEKLTVDGVCFFTPADVEIVCRDIAAEFADPLDHGCEPHDPVIMGGFIVSGCCGMYGIPLSTEETFRRAVLDSGIDNPITKAGYEIASLLTGIR
jgi:hypothetical protein